jgi:hypothetical protein
LIEGDGVVFAFFRFPFFSFQANRVDGFKLSFAMLIRRIPAHIIIGESDRSLSHQTRTQFVIYSDLKLGGNGAIDDFSSEQGIGVQRPCGIISTINIFDEHPY